MWARCHVAPRAHGSVRQGIPWLGERRRDECMNPLIRPRRDDGCWCRARRTRTPLHVRRPACQKGHANQRPLAWGRATQHTRQAWDASPASPHVCSAALIAVASSLRRCWMAHCVWLMAPLPDWWGFVADIARQFRRGFVKIVAGVLMMRYVILSCLSYGFKTCIWT